MSEYITIPHSSPLIGIAETEALKKCALSQHVAAGFHVKELEKRLAADMKFAGAVAASSGTQSLHLALRAFFRDRRRVIGVPSYVCRSVHDAVCHAGHEPRLLDIDPDTFTVAPDQVYHSGLDAVVIPHMFGIRAPVEQFMECGSTIIEDCAQRIAPSSSMRSEPHPPLRFLSFHATKLLTAGHGGIFLTDDVDTLERARLLVGGSYETTERGVWAELSDLQAVLALVQWGRLDEFLAKRHEIARYYLDRLDLRYAERIVPAMRRDDTHHFRFVLTANNPDEFIRRGGELGINFRRPVAPMPLHKLFKVAGDFSRTDKVFARLVSLPLYPRLSMREAQRVADVVEVLLSEGF
jgi:perosamine synthetase